MTQYFLLVTEDDEDGNPEISGLAEMPYSSALRVAGFDDQEFLSLPLHQRESALELIVYGMSPNTAIEQAKLEGIN